MTDNDNNIIDLFEVKPPDRWVHVEGRGSASRVVVVAPAGAATVVKRGFENVGEARAWADEYGSLMGCMVYHRKPVLKPEDRKKVHAGLSVYESHRFVCSACEKPILQVKRSGSVRHAFVCWICPRCLLGSSRRPRDST